MVAVDEGGPVLLGEGEGEGEGGEILPHVLQGSDWEESPEQGRPRMDIQPRVQLSFV